MRLQPKDTLRSHNWTDTIMMVFVVIMVCMLFILSFSSVTKQIDIKKSHLIAEAARFETNLSDIFKPFFGISRILQGSFESGESTDTGVIDRIQYDEKAGLSYLSLGTDASGGTLVSPVDLRAASGAVKEEAARAVRAIQPFEKAVNLAYYFISRKGYTIYFNRINRDVFLAGDGTYASIADAVQHTLDLGMARQADQPDQPEAPSGGMPDETGIALAPPVQAVALTRAYESAFGDGMVVTYLEPVTANGEIAGVLCLDIRLSELNATMEHMNASLGTIYLLSDTDEVLAGYAFDESLYDCTGFEEATQALLLELNISEETLASLNNNPDGILWRGSRVIVLVPVLYGGLRILYAIDLFALLSESNLLLWFIMGAVTLAVMIVLIVSLIRSRRKIFKSNIRLQENIKKLDFLSHYDRLTGLLTSESVIEKINHFIRLTPVIILMLDVDRFKEINDKYLHTFGNVVLKRVASIIREHMPPNAYAGRFGGDEFVCVLLDSTPEQAVDIAENIRAGVSVLKFREQDTVVTASIGIARSRNKETEEVLERADRFLYLAKERGRNRWVFEED